MDRRKQRIERQKQNRLEQLGTNEPICAVCGETHWNAFERHHIAGCRYCDITIVHCKNCHAKATALQKGHPETSADPPSMEETIGRLLLGLADFFELLIVTLRKFGEYLIEQARNAGNEKGGAAPIPEGTA